MAALTAVALFAVFIPVWRPAEVNRRTMLTPVEPVGLPTLVRSGDITQPMPPTAPDAAWPPAMADRFFFTPTPKMIRFGTGLTTGKESIPAVSGGGMLALAQHFVGGVSPDGRTVVTQLADQADPNRSLALVAHDARTGQPKGEPMCLRPIIPGPTPGSVLPWFFVSLAFSPDSQTLLTGAALMSNPGAEFANEERGEARLWDVETGLPLSEPLVFETPVAAVAFSPLGDLFVTGCGSEKDPGLGATIWDTATQAIIAQTLEHSGPVDSLGFTPDGKVLVTASAMDYEVALWNVEDGSPLGQRLAHTAGVTAMAISPDGQTLATGTGNGKVHLWRMADRQPLVAPLDHRAPVYAIAFSPDGQRLATGSADNFARIWDLSGTQQGQSMEHAHGIMYAGFDPSGRVLATADLRGEAQFWNGVTGTSIGPPMRGTLAFVFFGDPGHVLQVLPGLVVLKKLP